MKDSSLEALLTILLVGAGNLVLTALRVVLYVALAMLAFRFLSPFLLY